jgi:hypothetical protein
MKHLKAVKHLPKMIKPSTANPMPNQNLVPINIKITEETVGGENVYNFSYDPGTVHVGAGTKLEFHVTGVTLDQAWVVFDIPVVVKNFYVQVAPQRNAQVATVDQPGAHHYQFIGVHKGELVADVYCPSVIVH